MTVLLVSNRGVHDRPGGWVPKDLGSGLKLWLDADDAGTITISTGISQWNDKSGNAANATQATGAAQPSLVTKLLNGRAGVRFDGSAQYFATGASLSGVTSFATCIVAKSTTTNSAQSILRQQSSGSTNYFVHPWTNAKASTPRVILSWNGGTSTTNLTGSMSSAAISIFARDSGTSNKAWLNGTENSTRTATTTAAPTFGENMVIGRYSSNIEYYDGDLHEVVVYVGQLGTTDREKLEGYLAHKWGLAGSLPSGHTYKDKAP